MNVYDEENSNDSASPNEKGDESFRSLIQEFIKHAESTLTEFYSISQICIQFGFQRRRLYDVIHVFETIGMVKKSSVDRFQWFGRNGLKPLTGNFLHADNSFNQLNSPSFISMSSLTHALLSSFVFFQKKSLDIKQIAMFLSKYNGRYKTTLCKLYQITHILEAASIVRKSEVPGQITILLPPFIESPKVIQVFKPIHSLCDSDTFKILSIDSLLNKPLNLGLM